MSLLRTMITSTILTKNPAVLPSRGLGSRGQHVIEEDAATPPEHDRPGLG